MFPVSDLYVEGGYSISTRRNETSGVPETPMSITELTMPELMRLFEVKRRKHRPGRKDLRCTAS